MELGREHQLTMLFVSHDMAVIRQIAHRVLVMYRGQIVEQGDVRQVFTEPRETYTQTLLASIPGAATSV
jgi:oligopeptide transport system ATP-binding protein